MKRLLWLALAALGLVIAVLAAPLVVGRVLGLDGYQVNRPLAGTQVAIGGGRSLNVFDEGAGEPVILIHGLPGGAAQMGPLADKLVELGYRTVRYDRLGFGRSSARGAQPHTLKQNARELTALMEALDIPQAVLVGYSFGGGVVQEVGRLAPERIKAAALVSTIGPLRPQRAPQDAGAQAVRGALLYWGLSTKATAEMFAASSFATLFAPEPVSVPDMDAMLATLAKGDSVNTWLREGNGVSEAARQLQPEKVRAPTLVIHGEADAIVPVAVAEQVAQAIVGARFETIAGVGHALPMTRAGEVAAAIDAFLGGLGCGGADSPCH
jgi:pimeloyl-ACP methyl ester carboxylesterase